MAVLAILRAGGAYVPLDPAYPRERLAFMVEDTRPPVVVAAGRSCRRSVGDAACRPRV